MPMKQNKDKSLFIERYVNARKVENCASFGFCELTAARREKEGDENRDGRKKGKRGGKHKYREQRKRRPLKRR